MTARLMSRVSVVFTLLLVGSWSMPAHTQEMNRRRGGPRDWSHSRVIASEFLTDADQNQNLRKHWRTWRKRQQIERLRQARLEQHDGMIGALRDRFQMGKKKPADDDGAPELDWNLRTGGYGSVVGFPAKYNFDISASNCTDVIYFTVDQAGAGSTVNVIAITNPYAGCPGNLLGQSPTVKFGLRMGTGTATSPVPSFDGQTLYVFESRPSGSGGLILHAINVNNITSTPGTYSFLTTNWSNAHTLAAPTWLATSEQKFQLTFSGVTNNASSPWLDYETNQIFFGDSAGRIHRVINANSTSASRDTTNFPVSCGTQALQSPVFVDGQIIVTSADGRLYRIDTTLPPPYSCIAARQGGDGTGSGVGGGLSAPVVDMSNAKIIVATSYDNDYGLRGLGVFNLRFASGEAPTSVALLGNASTTIAPTSPTFDDDFWSTNDGNIYAAGSQYGGTGTYLIRVPYNGNLGSPNGFATLARTGGAATVATSPVTEFLTASSLANPDFIFIGGSSGNYKFMNRIRSGFNGTNTSPVAVDSSFAVPGGVSSGIIIDTRTTAMTGTTATANIYFGTVGIASTTQSTIVQLAQGF